MSETELKGKMSQSAYQLFGEGENYANIRVNRRGELVPSMDYNQLVIDGRVFGINMGTGDTEFPFVEVAYDDDQPQIGIEIPDGICVVPLLFEIAVEAQAGTLNQYALACGQCDALGAGTSTSMTPVNMLTRGGKKTGCTVFNTATADITANPASETNYFEFYRHIDKYATSDDETADNRPIRWSRYADGFGPIVKGPGFVVAYIYAGTTDAEGFLRLQWAEYETSELFP